TCCQGRLHGRQRTVCWPSQGYRRPGQPRDHSRKAGWRNEGQLGKGRWPVQCPCFSGCTPFGCTAGEEGSLSRTPRAHHKQQFVGFRKIRLQKGCLPWLSSPRTSSLKRSRK